MDEDDEDDDEDVSKRGASFNCILSVERSGGVAMLAVNAEMSVPVLMMSFIYSCHSHLAQKEILQLLFCIHDQSPRWGTEFLSPQLIAKT